jgi:Tfp pilus assembly protein FimT
MTMLGIVAVIAGAAVPLFSRLVLESRMNAAASTVMHAVNLARQFSATRSEAMRLCGSGDAMTCTGWTDWTSGILLVGATGTFRQSLEPAGSGAPRVRSNRASLDFEAGTGFATPATLTLCDRRGSQGARAVIVSRSGRPRTSDRDASDRTLTC